MLLEAGLEGEEVVARLDGPASISVPPANRSPEASAGMTSPSIVTASAPGTTLVPSRIMSVGFIAKSQYRL